MENGSAGCVICGRATVENDGKPTHRHLPELGCSAVPGAPFGMGTRAPLPPTYPAPATAISITYSVEGPLSSETLVRGRDLWGRADDVLGYLANLSPPGGTEVSYAVTFADGPAAKGTFRLEAAGMEVLALAVESGLWADHLLGEGPEPGKFCESHAIGKGLGAEERKLLGAIQEASEKKARGKGLGGD